MNTDKFNFTVPESRDILIYDENMRKDFVMIYIVDLTDLRYNILAKTGLDIKRDFINAYSACQVLETLFIHILYVFDNFHVGMNNYDFYLEDDVYEELGHTLSYIFNSGNFYSLNDGEEPPDPLDVLFTGCRELVFELFNGKRITFAGWVDIDNYICAFGEIHV